MNEALRDLVVKKMKGAILPGNSTVELKEFEIPEPGYGQVLVATKASTICGSDIRAIYREHIGKGPEGYTPGTVAGHEPSGVVAKTGPGCKMFKDGDRVIVYHISGCGVCYNCRMGYMIACTSPLRQAAPRTTVREVRKKKPTKEHIPPSAEADLYLTILKRNGQR